MQFSKNSLTSSLSIFLLLLTYFAVGQIPIGHWRDHFPYATMIDVQVSSKKVFACTEKALLVYNKEDNSIEQLTKINALSDIGISIIDYDEVSDFLVIGYTNGNVDVLKDDKIVNIPDIKRSNIIGEKRINNVLVNNNLAYLSCGFGIVLLDLVKNEVKDTYFLKDSLGNIISINDLEIFNGFFYVATKENGVYKADSSNPNLNNFSVWKKDTTLNNGDKTFSYVEKSGSKLYASFDGDIHSGDTTYVKEGAGSWEYFSQTGRSSVRNLKARGDNLIFVGSSYVKIFDKDGKKVKEIREYEFTQERPGPLSAAISSDDILWIADDFLGLVKVEGSSSSQLFSSGPYNSKASNLVSYKNHLYVAPNPLGRQNDKDGVFLYKEDKWINYNKAIDLQYDTLRAIVDINIDPNDPMHIFASSWRDGLFEINNGQFIRNIGPHNSSLQHHEATDEQVVIGASRFDIDGNLWVTNPYTGSPVSVRTPDGNWYAYNFNGKIPSTALRGFITDYEGQNWIILDGTGILVFNHNGTVTNHSDDKFKIITSGTGNGNLPGNEVKSMAVDKDGEVWIGTHKGVVVMFDPSRIFSGDNFDVQQILLDQGDGTAKPLLETEIITAITIDGANRKWIGTLTSGVFVMSEDGTKEIHVFNTETSPLISNTINDIEIDEVSGEVFIATDRGIMSYRSKATGGEYETFGDVIAFPNPVRENYDGVIAIKGLIRNADVKITDISGNIVHHSKSLGGQAIWDGRNFEGNKVAPGVYLVLSATEEGEEAVATKILVIN